MFVIFLEKSLEGIVHSTKRCFAYFGNWNFLIRIKSRNKNKVKYFTMLFNNVSRKSEMSRSVTNYDFEKMNNHMCVHLLHTI